MNTACRIAALSALADEASLRERLASALGREPHPKDDVVVGLHADGRTAYAAAGCVRSTANTAAARSRHGVRRTRPAAIVPAAAHVLRTGCLTKLFTSALTLRACGANGIALDSAAAELLPASASAGLSGATLRQLLEHRHGLDDALLCRTPLDARGFLDSARLVEALGAAGRLAAPGEVYSYSQAGAWLAAAVLERLSGRRYETLLRETLLEPIEAALRAAPLEPAIDTIDAGGARSAGGAGEHDPSAVCPSAGGRLEVGISTLLEFLLAFGPRPLDDEALSPGGEISPLPGWNAFERGVHLGWKYYGAGWFGHNSTWPGASALARVHPASRIALAVASTRRPATLVAAKLFGALLPELVQLRVPPAAAVEEMDTRRYEGVYRSAAWAVLVERSGDRRLVLHARPTAPARTERAVSARLRASADHLFFTEPPAGPSFTYVQFVSPCGDGFRYLWNGRFVLRRTASPAEPAARRPRGQLGKMPVGAT